MRLRIAALTLAGTFGLAIASLSPSPLLSSPNVSYISFAVSCPSSRNDCCKLALLENSLADLMYARLLPKQ